MKEHRQKLSDIDPVDFDFSPMLVGNVTAVAVTVPTGVTEVSAQRVISGQTVQCRFDVHSATVGNSYIVRVQGVTANLDEHTLDVLLVIET